MGIAGAGNSGTLIAILFAPRLAQRFGWANTPALATLPVRSVPLQRSSTTHSRQPSAVRPSHHYCNRHSPKESKDACGMWVWKELSFTSRACDQG